MSRWQHVRLSDVAYFQEGPGILARDFTDKGVPLVRLAGLGGYEVTLKGCNYVDPSKVERKWAHFKLKPGDILVSTSASFGRPAIVGLKAEDAIFYTGIIRFRSKSSSLDDGYLKLFLDSSAFMVQAEAMASGSVIRHFGPSHLREMTIPLPPFAYQQAMAEMAGALDDKIDLNRRMNETLEAMARALFKDWFVDFGPTRAKMEGRQPYLTPEIWALFPDRLDDEGKPEGWTQDSIGALADAEKGLSYKGASLVERGGLPMVNLGCFAGRGSFNREKLKRYAGDHRPRHLVKTGDLVLANTDMTQNRVILGSPALLPEIDGEDEFLFTHHVFALRFNARTARWKRYVYFSLLQPQFREIAEGFSTGTTVLALPKDGLLRYTLLLPSEVLLGRFDEQARTLSSAVQHNDMQARTLAQTRDLLLPKLMAGEIRVRDAERMVEDVV